MNKQKKDGIKYNDIVTIDYVGRIKNDEIVLSSQQEGPLTFKVGHFTLITGFNNAILGMKIGESKNCTFSPKECFGFIDESLIHTVHVKDLPSNIQVGQKISYGGKRSFFNVLSIDLENNEVLLDANHILAGQELSFVITVLSINYPNSSFVGPSIKSNSTQNPHSQKRHQELITNTVFA